MPTPAELETKFWASLKSDMTMMIGLDDPQVIPRPMTAQTETDGRGPIWFFTAKDTELIRGLTDGGKATATFMSKGHDLFATVQGNLLAGQRPRDDRSALESLCGRMV